MHYLSSVYFVNQPLHISGIFVAHHQEVYFIYRVSQNLCHKLFLDIPHPNYAKKFVSIWV